MVNRTMPIALAIDRIAELTSDSNDYEIIVSSTAALQTLGILQKLGFSSISLDDTNNMMMRD